MTGNEKINIYLELEILARKVIGKRATLEEFDNFVKKYKDNKPKMFSIYCNDLRQYIINHI